MLIICTFPYYRLSGEYPFVKKQQDHVGSEITSEIASETPEMIYHAGYKAFYKHDWRPRLHKKAERSHEGIIHSLVRRFTHVLDDWSSDGSHISLSSQTRTGGHARD